MILNIPWVQVAGHKSSLAFGLIGEGKGVPVVAMLGRVRLSNDHLVLGHGCEMMTNT